MEFVEKQWSLESDSTGVTSVTVPGAEFLKLLELAGDAVDMQDSEFSNLPTEEEIELLENAYEFVGEPIPGHVASSLKRGKEKLGINNTHQGRR